MRRKFCHALILVVAFCAMLSVITVSSVEAYTANTNGWEFSNLRLLRMNQSDRSYYENLFRRVGVTMPNKDALSTMVGNFKKNGIEYYGAAVCECMSYTPDGGYEHASLGSFGFYEYLVGYDVAERAVLGSNMLLLEMKIYKGFVDDYMDQGGNWGRHKIQDGRCDLVLERVGCYSTLKAYRINTNGQYLKSNGEVTNSESEALMDEKSHENCDNGELLTVKSSAVNGHKFQYWSEVKSSLPQNERNFTREEYSDMLWSGENKKIYAVYEAIPVCPSTLKSYRINMAGQYLKSNGQVTNNKDEALIGSDEHDNCDESKQLSVSRGSISDKRYVFYGWSKTRMGVTPTNSGSERYSTMVAPNEHIEVYAVYEPMPPVPQECASFIPSSYRNSTDTSGETSVVSKVRNKTLGEEEWKDETYGKPRDNIEWLHCYFPGAQKVANTKVTGTESNPDGGGLHGKHNTSLRRGGTTSNGYKALKSFYSNWSYSFKVTSSGFENPDNNDRKYTDTLYDAKFMKDQNIYTEGKGGKILTQSGKGGFPKTASATDQGKHSWSCERRYGCPDCSYSCNCKNICTGEGKERKCKRTCETCCRSSCYIATCQHSNNYIYGKASGQAEDKASALYPYNFFNTAEIELNNSDTHVFAGETASFSSAIISTATRTNELTGGTYATSVNGAEIKIVSFVANSDKGGTPAFEANGRGFDLCSMVQGIEDGKCEALTWLNNVTLNPDGKHELGAEEKKVVARTNVGAGRAANVYDAPAGKYYCVALGVYPANSGRDDMMSASGSDSWYVSSPSCKPIAKKPSLQVWGAGMSTNGDVMLKEAEKRIVDGVFPEQFVIGSRNSIVYGSWVEQNIIANGKISGLASGASTGKAGTTSRTKNGLGGSYEQSPSICNRSPLTMPNKGCSPANNPGGVAGSMPISKVREAITDKFQSGGSDFESHSECTINHRLTVPKGETHVYNNESCNTFTIDSDIDYTDETFGEISSIPKIIIIAKDIKIKCEVSKINAVLVAKGSIDTCYNGGSDSSAQRSKQLKINGAVITNKLNAGRTYGAATGVNSGVPAEIINYDTSLYLWGAYKAEASNSGKLETVYQTELAPRV